MWYVLPECHDLTHRCNGADHLIVLGGSWQPCRLASRLWVLGLGLFFLSLHWDCNGVVWSRQHTRHLQCFGQCIWAAYWSSQSPPVSSPSSRAVLNSNADLHSFRVLPLLVGRCLGGHLVVYGYALEDIAMLTSKHLRIANRNCRTTHDRFT